MLWDYLSFVIGNWDGEVVSMGDFNEVRDISERFGSIFNKHGAEAFNSFIVNTGLVKVPLGGCSFTWCHKSAKKMSKLDRFLISDNLMCSCPSISSTSLGRFLSDHRPIIMREAHYDYGPIPFNKFMNKLKYLKEKIQIWARLHKESLNSRKRILKANLAYLDGVIDKGEGSDADDHQRREGNENSKYYHGVLNKKRGRLTIRGVLIYGIWMESPHLVKHEFFEHFINRFENPNKSRILLEREFVKRISLEQNDDLEREVSKEEIKRAVWDCGIDKAPRPDSFTFGFYRRYWDIIGNDVVDAVKWFFCMEISRKEVLANRLVTVLDDIVDEIAPLLIYMNKSNLMGISVDSNKVKHAAAKIGASKYGIYSCAFFNGADVNSKKPSWVIWKSVLAAKDVGDLGVSNLFALNRVLMFKWVWRFFSQKIRYGLEWLKRCMVRMEKLVRRSNLVGSGDFSVSSVRKLIDNDILPKGIRRRDGSK
nr:RNA-directed DNA polymerase, eukaryota, reverse transcriptase zinc-binding domain protein [Tanacetum cinerariifolium]